MLSTVQDSTAQQSLRNLQLWHTRAHAPCATFSYARARARARAGPSKFRESSLFRLFELGIFRISKFVPRAHMAVGQPWLFVFKNMMPQRTRSGENALSRPASIGQAKNRKNSHLTLFLEIFALRAATARARVCVHARVRRISLLPARR